VAEEEEEEAEAEAPEEAEEVAAGETAAATELERLSAADALLAYQEEQGWDKPAGKDGAGGEAAEGEEEDGGGGGGGAGAEGGAGLRVRVESRDLSHRQTKLTLRLLRPGRRGRAPDPPLGGGFFFELLFQASTGAMESFCCVSP
jgi:hypothetical protein